MIYKAPKSQKESGRNCVGQDVKLYSLTYCTSLPLRVYHTVLELSTCWS